MDLGKKLKKNIPIQVKMTLHRWIITKRDFIFLSKLEIIVNNWDTNKVFHVFVSI